MKEDLQRLMSLQEVDGRLEELADRKKRIYDQDLLSLLPASRSLEHALGESRRALNLDFAEAIGR